MRMIIAACFLITQQLIAENRTIIFEREYDGRERVYTGKLRMLVIQIGKFKAENTLNNQTIQTITRGSIELPLLQ